MKDLERPVGPIRVGVDKIGRVDLGDRGFTSKTFGRDGEGRVSTRRPLTKEEKSEQEGKDKQHRKKLAGEIIKHLQEPGKQIEK